MDWKRNAIYTPARACCSASAQFTVMKLEVELTNLQGLINADASEPAESKLPVTFSASRNARKVASFASADAAAASPEVSDTSCVSAVFLVVGDRRTAAEPQRNSGRRLEPTFGRVHPPNHFLYNSLPEAPTRKITTTPNVSRVQRTLPEGTNCSVRVCVCYADFGDPRSAEAPEHPQNLSAHGQETRSKP